MKKALIFLMAAALICLGASGMVMAQDTQTGVKVGDSPRGPGFPYDQSEQGDESRSSGWTCPWCGQDDQVGQGGYQGSMGGRGMGPGMMGQGMGQGMMGQDQGMGQSWGRGPRGMGMGQGYQGGYNMHGRGYYGQRYGDEGNLNPNQRTEPLSKDQTRLLLENYLRNRRNPNLKVGEITEKDNHYEARILTKEGSLVDEIQVNKQSGWFRSVY